VSFCVPCFIWSCVLPMSMLRQCLHGNTSRCVVTPLAAQLLHLGQLNPWPSQRRQRCSSVVAEGAKSREAQLQWVSPENRYACGAASCSSSSLLLVPYAPKHVRVSGR
jgi:hypothetical protein